MGETFLSCGFGQGRCEVICTVRLEEIQQNITENRGFLRGHGPAGPLGVSDEEGPPQGGPGGESPGTAQGTPSVHGD